MSEPNTFPQLLQLNKDNLSQQKLLHIIPVKTTVSTDSCLGMNWLRGCFSRSWDAHHNDNLQYTPKSTFLSTSKTSGKAYNPSNCSTQALLLELWSMLCIFEMMSCPSIYQPDIKDIYLGSFATAACSLHPSQRCPCCPLLFSKKL